MVDRKARNEMAKAIQSYMREEITAFQFDDALTEVMKATEDHTVLTTGRALWFHYDDCKDHKIVASKEEWSYFYRLLLLLESKGELETIKSWRRWHPSQAVAAAFFAVFLLITLRIGFGEHLFAYALPFGPVSMALAWYNSRRRKKERSAMENALTPFPSVSSLLSVRRKVTDSTKTKYPPSLVHRRIRALIVNRLMWIPWSIAWCMFSPVALFFQMLPERELETTINMPKELAGDYPTPRAA